MTELVVLLAQAIPTANPPETPTFWDGLSIIGFVLTTIGTCISIWQAVEARKAAARAKTYRDEVVADRAKLASIQLLQAAREARSECGKIITPVDRSRPPRGVSPPKVVAALQNFVDGAREDVFRFQNDALQASFRGLSEHLQTYRVEQGAEERYTIADRMYAEVNSIIGQLSEQADRRL